MTAPTSDRGDNTARERVCICTAGEVRRGAPFRGCIADEHASPAPAADRQTDEERRLAWFTDDELAAELARRAAAADNSDGGSDA